MDKQVMERRVGFEFEHISDLEHSDMAKLLISNGIGVDKYATGHARCPQGCYDGWQVKRDGSITANSGSEYTVGIELVSPPMQLKQIAQLKKVLSLAALHGGINSSCGMHLHVECTDLKNVSGGIGLTDERLRKFTKAWSMIEPTIVNYLPPSRRFSSYARRGISQVERYHGLNLTPLASRNTVEFRMHNSTLNWQKAMAWAGLCTHIINKLVAICTSPESIDKFLAPVDPKLKRVCEPTKFRAKVGDLLLHRSDDKWAIENKREIIEEVSLRRAFEHQRERLGLKGNNHLVAFNYPSYGNAMSQLCDNVGLVGPYRGYVEDRYDHMILNHGYSVGNGISGIQIVDDEEDYFSEPPWMPVNSGSR